MRNLYEQEWQKAVGGAKIAPSEALWDTIESNLDREKGRNYWVTLLMIAATVTIAFSFPLTIGNSAFEARPDAHQYISHLNTNEFINLAPNYDSCNIENNTKNKLFIITKPKYKKSITTKNTQGISIPPFDNKTNVVVSDNDNSYVHSAAVQGVNFNAIDFEIDLTRADINNYYLIPFFMPLNNSIDRGLLASLNIGTGNTSNRSGSVNFEAVESAAKADIATYNFSSENRIEHASATFYFGTGIELPMGKRWAFLSGLGYLAQNAEGQSNVILDNGSEKIPMGVYDPIVPGAIFLSETYNYSATNSYISVPLSFKYPIINRKVKLRAGGGISTDFMLSHTINSKDYGKVSYTPNAKNYNAVVLSGLINIDVSYNLNNQYSIALETGYRRGITPIDENKNHFPSSFTVGIVAFYKIQ